MLGSLDQYIKYEKHYNQVIRNDNFIKRLQNNLQFSTSINKEFNIKNNQLINENNQLKEIISCNFNNQQIRIKTIKEIAQKERKNFYDNLINLINNQERFSLENLLLYTPLDWLSKLNSVIVKFIKTIIYNENENQLIGEKLFKYTIAIDAIYGTRNLKYVSAINLAALAIKYAFARSKSIIDIDNHIISSRSYSKFVKWLENLASKQVIFPEGFVFLAFDNEQKGQKNYLDHEYNTVIFHTVTNFAAF
ncbi:hypothetical protein F8M41_002144 [Gigaspora margarita]|uniref:Uncharacterized protein n=1 Tax=Gigaspora margarita TaxID=4874 RepID=A0A8H3XDB3_GIGMA|nr:hypothetical protein F8M41_002144 [Gigaspora margarita]